MSLVLILSSAILFAIWIWLLPEYPETRLISLATLGALLLVYGLSRTRAYLIGTRLLVTSVFLVVILIILTAPGSPAEQMQALYFLILGIIMAYLFLDWPAVGVTLLSAVGIVGWFFATRQVPTPLMYSFLVFFSITVGLGAVFAVLNHVYRKSLFQSEERYRAVVSALSEGIVVHAPDGSIVASNEAAASILGLTTAQLIGKDSFDPQWRSVHEDGSPFPPEEHPVMVTLRTGQSLSGVVMGVHQPDGALRWISINSKPLRISPGAVVSFADITEQRQAEQAQRQFLDDMRALQRLHLELSEVDEFDELLKQMVLQSQRRLGLERIGLLLLSEDETTLYGTYGCDPAGELRDEHYYTERVTENHWTLAVTQVPDHVRLEEGVTLYDDGLPVGVGWAAQSALWNGTRAIGYVVIDNFVTKRPPRPYERELLSILGSMFGHLIERKRSELALIESEQRQRALLSALPDLVLRLNADGVYLDLHAPNDSDLVAPRDQIIGRRIDQLLPADVSVKLMDALHHVMLTKEEQIIEYSLVIEGVLKDYEARMVAAQPSEALTVVRNVTERNRARQREFEFALEKERVRMLQHFFEKASHEFRTPLAIVNSNAYLMMRTDATQQRAERAAVIQEQVNRLTRMIDMLFLMSRLESGEALQLAPLDLALLVTGVCSKATLAHGSQPALEVHASSAPLIMGDAHYLQQAFTQILDNAYRFTPAHGSICVRVDHDDRWVTIEVQDTGCGIDPSDLPKIFDTFWQHDATDSTSGLGIGLSIAHRVITLHGGQIEAESAPEIGTTLRVRLQIAAAYSPRQIEQSSPC
ncbi:MAG: ATP-binding protein [Anaerolinea sp.]